MDDATLAMKLHNKFKYNLWLLYCSPANTISIQAGIYRK